MFMDINTELQNMKQKLIELKRKIDKSIIIVWGCKIPLSITDRTSRQEISKDIKNINNNINQPAD